MKSAPNVHAKRLVLFVWVLVLIFYFYISYDYLRVQRTDDKFAEAMQHIAQVGADRDPKLAEGFRRPVKLE